METLHSDERRILRILQTLNARIRQSDKRFLEAIQSLRRLTLTSLKQQSIEYSIGCSGQYCSSRHVADLDSGIFSVEYSKHSHGGNRNQDNFMKSGRTSLDVKTNQRTLTPILGSCPGTVNSNVSSHLNMTDEDPTSTAKQAELLFRRCVKSGDATLPSTGLDSKQSLSSHSSMEVSSDNSVTEAIPITKSFLRAITMPAVEIKMDSETEDKIVRGRKNPSSLEASKGTGMFIGDCQKIVESGKLKSTSPRLASLCPEHAHDLITQPPIFETANVSTPARYVSNAKKTELQTQESVQKKSVDYKSNVRFAKEKYPVGATNCVEKGENQHAHCLKDAHGVVSRTWLKQLVRRLQNLLEDQQHQATNGPRGGQDNTSKNTLMPPKLNSESPPLGLYESPEPNLRLTETRGDKKKHTVGDMASKMKSAAHREMKLDPRMRPSNFTTFVPVDPFCPCEEIGPYFQAKNASRTEKSSPKRSPKPPTRTLPPRPKSQNRLPHWQGIQVTTTIRPFADTERGSPRIHITNTTDSVDGARHKSTTATYKRKQNEFPHVKRIAWR